jgi:hypothetical protein
MLPVHSLPLYFSGPNVIMLSYLYLGLLGALFLTKFLTKILYILLLFLRPHITFGNMAVSYNE